MPKGKTSKPVATPKVSKSKSIRVEKVSNGFVVSTYTDTGEHAKIAKTQKEADKFVKQMLKVK